MYKLPQGVPVTDASFPTFDIAQTIWLLGFQSCYMFPQIYEPLTEDKPCSRNLGTPSLALHHTLLTPTPAIPGPHQKENTTMFDYIS